MEQFTVYLTSLGSRGLFPDNDNASFTNLLYKPLTGMNNYKVRLAACHLPALSPVDTVLVCSNIVMPTYFNDVQLPILGVYSGFAGDIVQTYSELMMDTVSMITCNLVDVNGRKISLPTVPIIVLQFKHK